MTCKLRRAHTLVTILLGLALCSAPVHADDALLPFRQRIEQAYNARDPRGIDEAIGELLKAGNASGQRDLATYYAAFGRLRQAALPGIRKSEARDYLEQCITGLEPLLERRPDYAQARALYASCLGASSSYYVLRAASRGIAAGREMAAAVKLAPDNPWVVFQDGVSDYSTPGIFGGDKQRALTKLMRADKLFVASRPAGSTQPVFGEAETWLYIGRVQLALDHKAEAKQALEKARSLAPDNADVRDALAKF